MIGFGADFLGTWNSPAAQSAAYGSDAAGTSRVRGTFVQVESRMSLDRRKRRRVGAGEAGHRGRACARARARDPSATSCGPATVRRAPARDRGLGRRPADYARKKSNRSPASPAARIERLARELAETSPAVAIGGPPLAHTNGLFPALAVNALNELLGAVGQPGGAVLHSAARRPAPSTRGTTLSGSASDGGRSGGSSARMLIVDGANPVYGAPKSLKIREALDKVPFIVSFASFVDETSAPRRSDPAGSLVSRVVGRAARVRIDRGGDERCRAGDEAALPDTRDG